MTTWTRGLLTVLWVVFAADLSALTLERVISSNLVSPTFLASPPGDDRLFVSERNGAIKVFDNAGNFLSTFLSLSDVNTVQEGGLLGFAFHPNYSDNGHIFVSYTVRISGTFFSRIERYGTSTSDPNVASTAPPKLIISVLQPQPNHNAGWIGFSPIDGYLYIPMGDGGNSHDFFNNGQNTNSLLGSILRLDIDTPDSTPYQNPSDNPFVDRAGLDEIWAYGVRNPWRAGFDRQTGIFYFGDVGQGSWEEINRGEKEGNFGWPLREGFVATPTGGVGGPLSPRVDPIHAYPNPAVGQSVVGGVVYRGPVLALQGQYLFAEFFTGDIWQMNPDGSNVTPVV